MVWLPTFFLSTRSPQSCINSWYWSFTWFMVCFPSKPNLMAFPGMILEVLLKPAWLDQVPFVWISPEDLILVILLSKVCPSFLQFVLTWIAGLCEKFVFGLTIERSEDTANDFKILSVYPPDATNIKTYSYFRIEIQFSNSVLVTDQCVHPLLLPLIFSGQQLPPSVWFLVQTSRNLILLNGMHKKASWLLPSLVFKLRLNTNCKFKQISS